MTISSQRAREAELTGAWRDRALEAEGWLRAANEECERLRMRVAELQRLLDRPVAYIDECKECDAIEAGGGAASKPREGE